MNNSLTALRVSIVKNAVATATTDATVSEILTGITTGKWRKEVEKIREVYTQAQNDGPKKAVKPLKNALPGVLWSGQFSTREKAVPLQTKLLQHSGIICADLDDIPDRLMEVRAKLVTSPHVMAVFLSPTGSGLKALFAVEPHADKHKASFEAIREHVQNLTGCEIDEACKDVTRLCFISYDPDLFIRIESTVPVPLLGCTPTPQTPPIRLNPVSCNTTSCIATSLHNNADSVLEKITARDEAMQALAAEHPKRPQFVSLYSKLIEARFQARAGERNTFITNAVTFLYRAVAPQIVLEFVGCFYDCNRALFNDSREQHMREAEAMLAGVSTTYTASLSDEERKIYAALAEQEQNTFRICRDLAVLKEPERPPLTFFIGFDHLADRLGNHPPEAQRIMWRLESYGVIRLLKKGTKRAKGVPGKAGTYQWVLST